ncbi:type II toxin-antitoxin system RelE/ParE family toxin [Reyranella sp.]|uniref:type II toxin-antitoxin system RelE/ParE family toxin n=1 Tax=Reyranella sp. TaxID=1929291 RepID=UPI003D1055C8
MAYRVRYLPKAVQQLDAILSYLAARNPGAARRVGEAIRRGVERIAHFPSSSRPSEVPGVRELPIVRYPYIVFYAVDDHAREIQVLRVRHTSQDPARHLAD